MIDFDNFLEWAEKHFNDINISDGEIKVNSIFCDDYKKHLWCNPSKNAYHCWKSDESGNLYSLVSMVSKCSYDEAVEILGGENEIRLLESRVEKFFAAKTAPLPRAIKEIELPQHTYLISNLSPMNRYRMQAEKYLTSRCLPIDGLYISVDGKYKGRIVIPYFGPSGELIYFNSRDITGRSSLRYMGPEKEIGVGKKEVLWMAKWAKEGTKIYLTEGEFDAMSLNIAGFTGAACGGKNFHDNQMELLHDQHYELLKSYKICVSFDTDKSGKDALNKIGNALIKNGVKEVSYIRPPLNFKDWNEMLVREGKRMIFLYVENNEKSFTEWTSSLLGSN